MRNNTGLVVVDAVEDGMCVESDYYDEMLVHQGPSDHSALWTCVAEAWCRVELAMVCELAVWLTSPGRAVQSDSTRNWHGAVEKRHIVWCDVLEQTHVLSCPCLKPNVFTLA